MTWWQGLIVISVMLVGVFIATAATTAFALTTILIIKRIRKKRKGRSKNLPVKNSGKDFYLTDKR